MKIFGLSHPFKTPQPYLPHATREEADKKLKVNVCKEGEAYLVRASKTPGLGTWNGDAITEDLLMMTENFETLLGRENLLIVFVKIFFRFV